MDQQFSCFPPFLKPIQPTARLSNPTMMACFSRVQIETSVFLVIVEEANGPSSEVGAGIEAWVEFVFFPESVKVISAYFYMLHPTLFTTSTLINLLDS